MARIEFILVVCALLVNFVWEMLQMPLFAYPGYGNLVAGQPGVRAGLGRRCANVAAGVLVGCAVAARPRLDIAALGQRSGLVSPAGAGDDSRV